MMTRIEVDDAMGEGGGQVLRSAQPVPADRTVLSPLPDPRQSGPSRAAAQALGGGAADPWLADQLLLPLAMANGPSDVRTSEITAHLLTNAEVIRLVLPVAIGVDCPIGVPAPLQVGPAPADADEQTRRTDDEPILRVECYAGHRADTEPRRLHIGQREVAVTEIIERWLDPSHRYFKLRGDDGGVYLLRHDTIEDRWELTLYDSGRRDETRLSST